MPKYIRNQLLEYSGIFYPSIASTMSGELRFWLSGTPPYRNVDNVPRATPRKLCFQYRVHHPSQGTYCFQGTMFLDVRCTTASLDAWRRFSVPEKWSWYLNDNKLAPQYLGISKRTAQSFGIQRCSLCTHNTQDLQGRQRCPEGFELHASLSLSPTGATVGDMGQEYLHRPYIWLPPSYWPSSR
jgi:hypothetical protein